MPFPASIPGLRCRHKASDPASLSVADGAPVTQISDLGPNGLHLIKFNTKPATYRAGGVNGKGVVEMAGAEFRADNTFASPLNLRRSIYQVWRMEVADRDPLWDTSNGIRLYSSTVTPQGYTHGAWGRISATASTRSDGYHLFTHMSDVNGETYAQPFGPAGIDGMMSAAINFGTGSDAGKPLGIMRGDDPGIRWAESIIFDRRLTWAEHHQIVDYVASEYGTFNPLQQGRAVVALGNSTTQDGYPRELEQLLSDRKIPVFNLGWSGGTVSTMQNQAADILALVTDLTSRGINVLGILHHGHNNAFNQDVINHIKSSQFATLRAIPGFKLMALTSSCRYLPGYEANRITLNNFLRSLEASNYIDGFYDFGGTPEFGDYGDGGVNSGSIKTFPQYWANTAEQPDNVHFSPAGRAKQAELMLGDVNEAFDTLFDPPAEPTLDVTPATATAGNGVNTVQITATLTDSDEPLSASVSGGGTLSTNVPVSGVGFAWTKPISGSGTATITVAGDGLTDTCVITYAANVVATPVYPPESKVELGYKYGPTGTEYTGSATFGGGGSFPTVDQIAAAILLNPDDKIATNPDNTVNATVVDKTGYELTDVYPTSASFTTQAEAEQLIPDAVWSKLIDGLRADVILAVVKAITAGSVDVDSQPGQAIFMRTDGVTEQVRAEYSEGGSRIIVSINDEAV